MTIDVVIPTLKQPHAINAFESLKHVRWPFKLHVISERGTWAQVVNKALKECEHDVLLMDDDVVLNPYTFSSIDFNYGNADMFGFKLLFPDGRIQHMGGVYKDGVITHYGYGDMDGAKYADAVYTSHVTTSLAYIKREVLKALGGMAEDIPGIQFEDVDFSFRALKAGFKIMCLPQTAIHFESATKRKMSGFGSGMQEAFNEIKKRHLSDPEFVRTLGEYPK